VELMERPPGYRGPNLDPTGARLRPKRLAEGVYALMAFPPPKDNSGLVIGQHGALVIDAGINPAMAHQIQQTVIAEVTSWRRPDVVFDDHAEVDLGGRTVRLWHFGPGNRPGDTVVWVPEARAAWTGNLLGHHRVTPMLLEGGPAAYIDTLARFKSTLEVKTVVPGHGPLAEARPGRLDGLPARAAGGGDPGTPAGAERPGHGGIGPAAPQPGVPALAPGRPHQLAGP
jgi:hypothetical protein